MKEVTVGKPRPRKRSWLDRFRSLRSVPSSVERLNERLARVEDEIRALRVLSAKASVEEIRKCRAASSFRDVELSVYSQFGDDGIIQYLIARTGIEKSEACFIEFGVEDYAEANTRFLLENDNWRGLIIDRGVEQMESLRRSDLYWRHDLTAAAAMVDRENVNEIFRTNGFSGSIGLLSIDIDGMDYWVWAAITEVDPVIVVIEYNAVFGGRHPVAVPYEAAFERGAAHWSQLYWGCSLAALAYLAERKGYAFVGCNSAGNNAYFVRKNRICGIPIRDPFLDFVESRFRDSRDRDGNLTFLSGRARAAVIAGMPLWDVERERRVTLEDLGI